MLDNVLTNSIVFKNTLILTERIKMKKAFTMAEVLITLGIIGVVAAMTLPTLTRNYQHKILEAQLKKAYSTISQALTRMYLDQGEDLTLDNYPNGTFVKILKKYLLTNQYSDRYGIAGVAPDDRYQSEIYRNYNNTDYAKASLLDEGQMIINDGMAIFIQNSQFSQFGLLITIDVNGIKKRPNKWGHDLYTFRIDKKGHLIPSEEPNSTYMYGKQKLYCSSKSTERENGLACTYYAINNICPDDNTKSYWDCLPK